ncbi:hypothetical protein, partial [Listeria monocytogenes]|uniref:hypothetical protein n=1 Tax=Listeria monocytogenes TaxID=1639 RepID=UPI001A90EBCF
FFVGSHRSTSLRVRKAANGAGEGTRTAVNYQRAVWVDLAAILTTEDGKRILRTLPHRHRKSSLSIGAARNLIRDRRQT